MWHRRRRQHAQHRPDPRRRAEAARIPRLRLLRRRGASGRRAAPRAQHLARGRARGRHRERRHPRQHRHRAHALGHARRAGGAQRAPAFLQRAGGRDRRRRHEPVAHRAGPQRHHREPRRTARRAAAARLRLRQPDRHRGHRPPGAPALRRRPARRRAARAAAAARRLRDRGVLPRRAAPRGRRAPGIAAGAGPGPGRELPRQRRDGAGRRDRPDRLPRRGRRRRPADGPRLGQRAGRRRPLPHGRAPGAHGAGAQRRGRAGAVPALHAEGDLRAAQGDRRHAGRRGRHQPRAVRRRRVQGLQGGRPGADPGLRHQLLLGQHRALLARGHRRHPDHGGDRERIPLPRQRAEPAHAGRHDQPERRDRRHAGGAEARARRWA